MDKFPCTKCGMNVDLSKETQFLNRGDGICKYFDMSNYLCSIYETRPEICRVDVQYKKHYKQLYSWDDFVKLNLKICVKLEEKS
jgi:Fe-S-cluster containining protein